MAKITESTKAELMRLSPADKLEAAAWLRREALEEFPEPGEEGSTVAEASAVLMALRGLDKTSRGLIVAQIMREEAAG